eukprot:343410_1
MNGIDAAKLAVELLYGYCKRNQLNNSICLLLSDFDEWPSRISHEDRFAFLSAFLKRFEGQIENQREIGNRIVITCQIGMVSHLYYFMDHVYTKYYEYTNMYNHNQATSPSSPPFSPSYPQPSPLSPISSSPSQSEFAIATRQMRSESEPQRYNPHALTLNNTKAIQPPP